MTPLITLIEDNASDIELIRTAFDENRVTADFTIHSDGESAIANLRRTDVAGGPLPDLILLDLNLPRASGLEVLLTIRTLHSYAATPVVVFSTSSHQTDRLRCIHAGANDYLVKPPHFEELLILVRGLHERWLRPR